MVFSGDNFRYDRCFTDIIVAEAWQCTQILKNITVWFYVKWLQSISLKNNPGEDEFYLVKIYWFITYTKKIHITREFARFVCNFAAGLYKSGPWPDGPSLVQISSHCDHSFYHLFLLPPAQHFWAEVTPPSPCSSLFEPASKREPSCFARKLKNQYTYGSVHNIKYMQLK